MQLLRSILRQDPNIIMIGEIRDTETAKIAVRASITGHLVLSTLHTNNSLNTIERLLDMEVERYLLSSALTGIVSQKLARRLCPHCREKRPTNEYEKELFKKVIGKDIEEVYTTVGCEECGNGYKGRIAIHEVLMINDEIKDAISRGIRRDKLRELVYKSDVVTLLQDGLYKVANGLTTFEELLKIIELDDDDKVAGDYDLQTALKFANINNEEHEKIEKEKALEHQKQFNKKTNDEEKDENNNEEDSKEENNKEEDSKEENVTEETETETETEAESEDKELVDTNDEAETEGYSESDDVEEVDVTDDKNKK